MSPIEQASVGCSGLPCRGIPRSRVGAVCSYGVVMAIDLPIIGPAESSANELGHHNVFVCCSWWSREHPCGENHANR
jgi:hypothetical protein